MARHYAGAGPNRGTARLRSVLVAIGLVAESEDRCLDAVLQPEFGEDAADVGLDGLLADCQVPGDLPVAMTAGDQPEYFAFAWCERQRFRSARRPDSAGRAGGRSSSRRRSPGPVA